MVAIVALVAAEQFHELVEDTTETVCALLDARH